MDASQAEVEESDVIIIGAGISGIGSSSWIR